MPCCLVYLMLAFNIPYIFITRTSSLDSLDYLEQLSLQCKCKLIYSQILSYLRDLKGSRTFLWLLPIIHILFCYKTSFLWMRIYFAEYYTKNFIRLTSDTHMPINVFCVYKTEVLYVWRNAECILCKLKCLLRPLNIFIVFELH